MPASLINDTVAWLRMRGAPTTTRNLNAGQAYLAENPDQRPSYAQSDAQPDGSGVDNMMELAMNDGSSVTLDTGEGVDPVIPQRKPTQGVQPRIPGRKPPMPDGGADVGQPEVVQPQMKGDSNGEPNPLYVEEPPSEETGTSQDDGPDVAGIATGAGAAVGAGASLAAELKRAYDQMQSTQLIRDKFAEHVFDDTTGAIRGSRNGGGLPNGIRPEMQPYQISALEGALQSIKDGNMKAAEKWLTYLSPEDQKALRAAIDWGYNNNPMTTGATTAVQRGMRSGEALIRGLANTLRRRP